MESIKLPENLTSIGRWAFNRCESLKSITIPSKVTELGRQTFFNCVQLKEINGCKGVQKLGYQVFGRGYDIYEKLGIIQTELNTTNEQLKNYDWVRDLRVIL